MNFILDKQTLDDLNIFGKQKAAVYNLFNETQTRGGSQILEEMFRYPVSDVQVINRRSRTIQYFQQQQLLFPFRNECFDTLEHYLENTDERSKLATEEDNLQRRLKNMVGADTAFEQLQKGILAGIEVFNRMKEFIHSSGITGSGIWEEETADIQQLLAEPQFEWVYEQKDAKKLAFAKVAAYDRTFRFAAREKLKKLLHHIYHLDVYISIARVATAKGFAFAKAVDTEENFIRIEKMYHPALSSPVANSLVIDSSSNVIFLTGANMAGKSTFMKTLGITVFLAHMGFPVPAASMEFAVQGGLFTTINLADNLNLGYSHFYSEVLRLKQVAEQSARTPRLVIIFDELFRGTNVKDAYDATLAVTEAFADRKDCTFILSTHIIEAGEVLKQLCSNIHFVYFPTVMKAHMPEYTYQLTDGITNDRHGMMIIGNENIIGILKSRKPVQTS